MKYLGEYREKRAARRYARAIERICTRPWKIMEICGGQTHSIIRYGLDELLPDRIELIHGPGCPVCVTSLELIDRALELARRPDIIFCTFGDMMRVPGSHASLARVKAEGGDVRVVYSPLDALEIARNNPDRDIVFFAIGFETTAPVNALAAFTALREELSNFFLLVSHVLVPPAVRAILDSPRNQVQALLAAGHVCTIMGLREYEPLAARYKLPVVAAGFEPVDILQGIFMCVKQLEEGRHEVENQYARYVRREGNARALELMREVFEVVPRKWRGIGSIDESGLALRGAYRALDAEHVFKLGSITSEEPAECRADGVLMGVMKPDECPAFGKQCTPAKPLGAPMVSSEGACAAYYNYRAAGVPAPDTRRKAAENTHA